METKDPSIGLTLAEIQLRMRAFIRNPLGRNPNRSEANDFFADSGTLDSRLSVYAEGYFERLSDGIRESFPRVSRILGQERFIAMVADYLEDNPSRVRNLNEVGANLPDFFRVREAFWLSELARLEWAALESFLAPDNAKAPALAVPPPERWAATRVSLNASVIPLELSWSVHELWEMEEGSDEELSTRKNALRPGDFGAVVYRQDEKVWMQAMEKLEIECLSKVYRGMPLGEIVEGLSSDLAPRFQSFFGAWASSGWIFRLEW